MLFTIWTLVFRPCAEQPCGAMNLSSSLWKTLPPPRQHGCSSNDFTAVTVWRVNCIPAARRYSERFLVFSPHAVNRAAYRSHVAVGVRATTQPFRICARSVFMDHHLKNGSKKSWTPAPNQPSSEMTWRGPFVQWVSWALKFRLRWEAPLGEIVQNVFEHFCSGKYKKTGILNDFEWRKSFFL